MNCSFLQGIMLIVAVSVAMSVQPVWAQDGARVLVVVNELNTDSVEIGERYATVRSVPPAQILRLRMPPAEQITRQQFQTFIERRIATWLTQSNMQDKILHIVLTKGVPLRISGSAGQSGTIASVDSELALLYRRLLGYSVPPAGRVENPLFQQSRPLDDARPFSHTTHDIYLVTRLDGFTKADAISLIDRCASAARNGRIVLDQRGGLGLAQVGDNWLSQAADSLSKSGFSDRVVLDKSSAPVKENAAVLGYFSWGSNDTSQARLPGIKFAPGAIAGMFVSTDARTFKEPPASWALGNWRDRTTFFEGSPQSLVGDLIRQGVTGVAGHVAEPYLEGSVRPQILFPAYLAGFNLAESFYMAMPYLSWQNVVIGDPLCSPFAKPDRSVDAEPPFDKETELPQFFSDRRIGLLRQHGVAVDIAKRLLRAGSRLMKRDFAAARSDLEAVVQAEPTLNAAHFVLAGLYEAIGELDRAVDSYQAILTTAPNEVRSLNNLAYLLAVARRQPQEALPLAEKAHKLAHEAGSEVAIDLTYSLTERKGSYATVLPFGDDGLSVDAIRAQIADTLAWTLHLTGNSAEAEKYIGEAVKGADSTAEVHVHAAAIAEARGRIEDAVKSLDRATELDAKLAQRDDVVALRGRLGKPDASSK
jgi:uncharacterized protein (TIGR03790 family)